MRLSNYNLDACDAQIDLWLGSHYNFEAFSSERSHLNDVLQPLVKKIESYSVPTVIVGGTNGKGEVSLHLEEMALQNGLRPFVWTSPHILTSRERFCFNGEMIEGEQLLLLFKKNEHLTSYFSYYEFLFYNFCCFVLEKLNDNAENAFLILEVGLGGRLDATNYFNCDVACLTSIGLDHCQILGHTLGEILAEKIEITRSGKSLVSGVGQGFLQEKIRSYCASRKVLLTEIGASGNFKARNEELAKCAFEQSVKRSRESIVYKPGRLFARPLVMTDNKSEFILLGTHNLDGLRVLVDYIKSDSAYPTDECWVGMSRTDNKEIESFSKLLLSLPCLSRFFVFTTFDHPRATPLDQIKQCVDNSVLNECVAFDEDWKKKIENLQTGQRVLVMGSYFFMGEVLRFLLYRSYKLS